MTFIVPLIITATYCDLTHPELPMPGPVLHTLTPPRVLVTSYITGEHDTHNRPRSGDLDVYLLFLRLFSLPVAGYPTLPGLCLITLLLLHLRTLLRC